MSPSRCLHESQVSFTHHYILGCHIEAFNISGCKTVIFYNWNRTGSYSWKTGIHREEVSEWMIKGMNKLVKNKDGLMLCVATLDWPFTEGTSKLKSAKSSSRLFKDGRTTFKVEGTKSKLLWQFYIFLP